MNEDVRINPVALRPDRYAETNLLQLHAIVSRLDELLSKPQPGNLEWCAAYRTNVSDFLELFNATTPNLPCACDRKFGK